jgi:hypothetical protein
VWRPSARALLILALALANIACNVGATAFFAACVVMSTASQGVMSRVSVKASLYSLAAGLGEMLTLGLLYGLTLEPAA